MSESACVCVVLSVCFVCMCCERVNEMISATVVSCSLDKFYNNMAKCLLFTECSLSR